MLSRYDNIRNIVLDIACKPKHLPVTLAVMHVWLDELATGNFARGADLFAALVYRLAVQPLPPTPPLRQPHSLKRQPNRHTSAIEPTLGFVAEFHPTQLKGQRAKPWYLIR